MRPSISALDVLGAQRLQHRMQRRLGVLDHHQAARCRRSRADRRFRRRSSRRRRSRRPPCRARNFPAGDSRSSTLGRSSRSSTLTGASRSASPPSSSDGIRLGVSPSRRARVRIASGLHLRRERGRRHHQARDHGAAVGEIGTTRSRSSKSPSTGMPRIDWPRSAGDCDRMPTAWIFLTAPLSIAAQQHLGIGRRAEHDRGREIAAAWHAGSVRV